MVEHHDALGARHAPDECLDFGVIDALQLVEVEEILHGGAVLDQHESIRVESELARLPAICDLDAMPFFTSARTPTHVVRPERLVDKFFPAVAGVGDFGLHACILECGKTGGIRCITAAISCASPPPV